jgi:hypothetical protein
MSDDRPAGPEHVERLLRALPNESDRLHCLREYIFDQVPPDYAPNLSVNFGTVEEVGATYHADELTQAIDLLRAAAVNDIDLRRLLTDLSAVVVRPGRLPPAMAEQAYEEERGEVRKLIAKADTPTPTAPAQSRAAQESPALTKSR